MSKKFSSRQTDLAEYLAEWYAEFVEDIHERDEDIRDRKDKVRVYKWYAEAAGSSWGDVSDQKKKLVKEIVKAEQWYEKNRARFGLMLMKAASSSTMNEASGFLDSEIERLQLELDAMPESLFTLVGVDELAERRSTKAAPAAKKATAKKAAAQAV